MDWTALLPTIIPAISSFLKNLASTVQTPTAPTPSTTVSVPNAAIKDLQHLLNVVLKPNPPLKEDGWLGPKTDAAIEQLVALAKSFGYG